MKTENSTRNETVWANNVELLTQEECLPVIGSCQVSSILQNLDTTDPQNVNLIILPPNDIKIPIDDSYVQNNYVIIKENGLPKKERIENDDKLTDIKKQDSFEDMLYFVCNLCPFLCTKVSKITEHLENAHKNRTIIKLPELKCPACLNIFYHRMSLRSHLIHDHGVGNSDLNQIIQAIIHYSTKKKEPKVKNAKKGTDIVQESNKIEKRVQENNSNSIRSYHYNIGTKTENFQKEESKVVLPQFDISQNNSEKIISNLMKETIPLTKYIDSKKINKCVVPGCRVRLQSVDKMNFHISCHTESGFKCNECGEQFLCWRPLAAHLWRLHKVDMDLFACDKCDYKTISLAKLNNIHKLIHSDVRAFTCNICSKAFKNSKQLRNHKLTHRDKSKKLSHTCEQCLRSFIYKSQLTVHMDIVHKKIKPYLCSFCGYKGSSMSSLKMHIRQHTGEKPFSCNSCSYSTADHNSLRRHKLRHTGQKPYKCSYCSYACIQSSTYKAHLKTQHAGMEKDLMFTCSECQFRSVNKDMYASHMMTVHKMNWQEENKDSSIFKDNS